MDKLKPDHLNEKKTEYINNCKLNNDLNIKTINNTNLKCVEDYKYLGSYISYSDKDFNTRKAMEWSACNNMHKIWTSMMNNKLKTTIFRTTIEPILLYGSETWTLSKKLEKMLDGTYTRLLMRVKCLSWKHHPTREQICDDLHASKLVQ